MNQRSKRANAWSKSLGLAVAVAGAVFASGAGLVAPVQASPAATQGAGNGIYQSPALNKSVPQTFDGTTINWVTGVFDDGGPINGDWDLNFWGSGTGNATFDLFAVDDQGDEIVVDADQKFSLLQSGAVIGPSSTFKDGDQEAAAGWLAGADGYIGFKFNCDGRLANPVAGGVCYGYVHVTTTAPSGFPATIVDYAYDGDGNPITIGPVETFTVTPSVGTPSGTISPDTPQTVNSGATASFTLTADSGFHVDAVGGTCGGSLAGNVYTTTAVTADCTVIANFAAGEASPAISVTPSPLAISVDAGATGTGTLTVANTGGGTLTWSIAEAPAKAPARHAHASKRSFDAARGHFPLDRRQVTPVGQADGVEPKLAPRLASPFAAPAAAIAFGSGVNGFAQVSGTRTLVSLDFNAPGTLTAVGPANGEPFWGAGFLDGDTSTLYMLGDSGLFSVDTTTGAATEISGSAGGGDVWGMTADPSTNTLYWIGPTSDQELSTVDPVTGATTLIAAITGAAVGDTINAIAADAQGHLYGTLQTGDSLISIDKTTGDTAVIGSLGVNVTNLSGLAFDPASGTLYFANAGIGVFTVDVTTGVATAVGAAQDSAQLVAMAIGGGSSPAACDSPGDVPWLSVTPASGSLAGGASADATVTVDASALAAGSYSANLCVTSNDAATPLVTVPVDVTVEATTGGDPCSAKDTIFCDGFDGEEVGPFEQPVQDPGFEATPGNTEVNPFWEGSDSNDTGGGTPFYETSGLGNPVGHGGEGFAAWGGGWDAAGTQEWSQSVTIPSGGPRWLNYWRFVDQAPDGTATLTISVDGTAVSTTDIVANGVDADWTNVSVDLSDYADDAAHEIRFEYTTTGAEDGNCFVDDITIDEAEGSSRR
ncbi:BACON domain-containing protein [Dokdonella ginsengisoli]|uniref:BACON domain-containing protein n=1 Tax=Dokdonella ginsengisoli TaxID=363846 RepID=A0ABV9QXH1_9GAMM